MQFERNSKIGLAISTAVLLCVFFAGAANSETLIYDNSTYADNDWPGAGYELIDYGTTTADALVTDFTIAFGTDIHQAGPITVRFYEGTYYYSPGYSYPLATFQVNLPYVSDLSGLYTFNYQIPTNKQFILPAGSFGYSMQFSDNYTYVVLAKDGPGNEDYFWALMEDWYTGTWSWERYQPPWAAWAGFYMQIYADPPPQPTTVSGYKFDDADGDGVWDPGEDDMPGWLIYIDENNNGQFDSMEPNDITDPNGYYEFLDLPTPDTITVAEEMQEGWTQTLPGGAGTYQFQIVANGQYTNKNFGNTDEPVIPGDIAYPKGVGMEDFSVISANWRRTTSIGDIAPPPAGDGEVNELDILLLAENWLKRD